MTLKMNFLSSLELKNTHKPYLKYHNSKIDVNKWYINKYINEVRLVKIHLCCERLSSFQTNNKFYSELNTKKNHSVSRKSAEESLHKA